MYQRDYSQLLTRANLNKIGKKNLEKLEQSDIAIFITTDPDASFSKGQAMIIGYSIFDEFNLGDSFTNPFNRRSYLEVIDMDDSQERILMLVREF